MTKLNWFQRDINGIGLQINQGVAAFRKKKNKIFAKDKQHPTNSIVHSELLLNPYYAQHKTRKSTAAGVKKIEFTNRTIT